MTFIIAFIITISISFISSQAENRIPLHENMKLLRQELMKVIPIGSRVTDAKKLMEQNGFKCKMKEKAAFVEYDERNNQILHENEDYLWCDKSRQVAELISRRWQVIITHKREVVTGVYVSSGIKAP